MRAETGSGFSAVAHNIARSNEKFGVLTDIRAAHLCEIAHAVLQGVGDDSLPAICGGDTAREIYSRLLIPTDMTVTEALAREGKYFSGRISDFDKFFICREMIGGREYDDGQICAALAGETSEDFSEGEVSIAFSSGKAANAAFEEFAKFFRAASPVDEDNFQSACDFVAGGDGDYCILPVENSSDGRLGGFYSLIEKNGLYIVASCRVRSRDGESHTRFALCSRRMGVLGGRGEKLFHFRITLDSMNELCTILSAGEFFGAEVKRTDIVPPSLSGRDNSLDMIFGGECDLAGFICFLKLEFPQLTPIGLYRETEGIER